MSFTVDQYVYNIPSSTVIIYGSVSLNETKVCISSPIKIQFVLNSDVSGFFILDKDEISLSLNLICSSEKVAGSVEYDTSQFFTVNADHPLIRQIIPSNQDTLPPNITIRLPTQKVVKAKAVGLTYSKCLDYFKCSDYVLEIDFPLLTFTSQFNYTIEIKTTNLVTNQKFCRQSQILKTNCGKSCFSFISFSEIGNKINLANIITLCCNNTIICFYPHNKIKTLNGWRYVKDINREDYLLTTDPIPKSYRVNRVFRLPIFRVIKFIQFPENCISEGVPSGTCYLTPEHMVKSRLGVFSAEQYYQRFRDSHGIQKISLYTEHIYSFEVLTKVKDIFVDYEGLPSRVWSLDEKEGLKKQLSEARFQVKELVKKQSIF